MRTEVFDDLINFIVDKVSLDDLLSFRPSPRAQGRLDELSDAVKAGVATLEDHAEIEQSLQLEHMMLLAKARARRKHAAVRGAT